MNGLLAVRGRQLLAIGTLFLLSLSLALVERQSAKASLDQTLYLRSTGSLLRLDAAPPVATAAVSVDSAGVNFAGGNAWRAVGEWPSPATLLNGNMTSVEDAHLWVGLRNSDDQGTRFDLRVELFKDGSPVATGLTRCISGVTRNPSLAKEVVIPFGTAVPTQFNGTTNVLSFKASVRIGTNPDDTKCPGHNNAVGLRLYFDAAGRPSRIGVQTTPIVTRAFVADAVHRSIHVIEGNVEVATIDMTDATDMTSHSPIAIAVAPGGTHAVTVNRESNSVTKVDLSNLSPGVNYGRVTRLVRNDAVSGPISVALSVDGSRAFVGTYNGRVFAVDLSAPDVLIEPSPPLGYVGRVWDLQTSPLGDRVFAVLSDRGELGVFNPATLVAEPPITIVPGPNPASSEIIKVAVSPDGRLGVVTMASAGSAVVVDLTTGSVSEKVPVGGSPTGVAIDSCGTRAYATAAGSAVLTVIDLTFGLAVPQANSYALPNTFNHGIAVIQGDSRLLIVQGGPDGSASPFTGRLYEVTVGGSYPAAEVAGYDGTYYPHVSVGREIAIAPTRCGG